MSITLKDYAYVVSTGTANGAVDASTLIAAIRESDISIAVSHIETEDDTLRVWFKDNLSANEQASLTLLVAAHTGVPEEEPPQTVVIREERYGTGGQYQCRSFDLSVPASDPAGDWSELDLSWPYPVSVFSAEWAHMPNMEGDIIQLLIAPDTTVGFLRSAATVGDQTIEVQDSVVEYLKLGNVVRLVGAGGIDNCGRAIEVDKVAKTVKLENPLMFSHTAAPLTAVQMTVEMIPSLMLRDRYVIEIGKDMIGGSYVPANTPVRLRYQNNEGSAKIFSFIPEYKY